jgi:hypothetical protein
MEIDNKDLTIFVKNLPSMSTKKIIEFMNYNDPFCKFLNKMTNYNYKDNSLIIQFSNKNSMEAFICEFFNFYKYGTTIELYYFGEKSPIDKKKKIIIISDFLADKNEIIYPNYILTYKNHLDCDIKTVLKNHGVNKINKYVHYDSDKELFFLKSPDKKGWIKYKLECFIYDIIVFMYPIDGNMDCTEFIRISELTIDSDSDELQFNIVANT